MYSVDQATRACAAEIAKLHRELFPAGWDAASISALIDSPGVRCLIVRAETGDLAGILITRRAADEAEILTVGVAQRYQRQGVARAMMSTAFMQLAGEGVKSVLLEVAADNSKALELYRSLGFLECGRRRGYYETGRSEAADALVMERRQ